MKSLRFYSLSRDLQCVGMGATATSCRKGDRLVRIILEGAATPQPHLNAYRMLYTFQIPTILYAGFNLEEDKNSIGAEGAVS